MTVSPATAGRCPVCGAPFDPVLPRGICVRCTGRLLLDEPGDLPPADGVFSGDRAVRDIPPGPAAVFGDFELIERLGRGGAGTVWRGKQRSVGRAAAVKVISGGVLAAEPDRRRFLLEAEAAGALRHPNIVPVIAAGETEGCLWLAMQLIEGRSLAAELQLRRDGHRPYSPREAAGLARTLAEALAHAHSRGVLHRDIKPGNVMLDAAGTPFLTDFGLARMEGHDSSLTQSGGLLGTPAYMAPEQVENAPAATTAADIYALGALLYEVISGRPPFQAAAVPQLLQEILHHEPPPLRSAAGGGAPAPRDLAAVTQRCLDKNPRRRYSSAAALAEDLRRWLDGETVMARPPGRGERMARWIRRRPAVAFLLFLTALLSAGGFAGIAWQWQRAAASAEQARQSAQKESAARREAQQSAARAARALYAAEMNLCQQALAAGNLGRARQLLEAHRPAPGAADLRGWEWRHLQVLCRGDAVWPRTAIPEHAVRSLSLSPDGSRLAVLARGDDCTVQIRDAQTLRLLSSLPGSAASGETAFSPDGGRIAAGAADGIDLFRSADASRERNLPMGTAARGVAWNGSGTAVAALGMNGNVRVWNAADGAVLHNWQISAVNSGHGGRVCFLPGEPLRLAAGTAEGKVMLLQPDKTAEVLVAAQGTQAVMSLAVSSDGSRLAAGFGYEDTAVYVCDLFRPGDPVRQLRGHQSWISRVAFMPDSTRLVSAGADQTLRVWDAAGGGLLRTFRGHTDEIHSLTLSTDGKTALTGGRDGSILKWDPDAPARAGRFDFPPETLALSHCGNRVAGWVRTPGGGNRARLMMWDPQTWQSEDCTIEGVNDAFLPGIAFRGTGPQTEVFDLTVPGGHHEPRWRLALPPRRAVHIWPARRLAVVIARDGALLQIDFSGPDPVPEPLPAPPFSADQFMLYHEGLLIAVQTQQRKFSLLQLGRSAWSAAADYPFDGNWVPSPDGKWIGGLNEREIRLLPPARGGGVSGDGVLRFRQEKDPGGFAFSPDNRWFAAGTQIGACARLFDLTAEHPVPRVLKGHRNAVHDVLFTRDSARLVTLCSDSESAKFWDTETGLEVLTLAGSGMARFGTFVCGGRILLVKSGSGWHAWYAPSFEEIDTAERDGRW